jgi:phage terminase small subunit
MAKSKKPELSTREVTFCRLYVEHGNATRAFKEAGLESSSEGAIREAASYLLTKPDILKFCDELRQWAAESAKVTVERISEALSRIAFGGGRIGDRLKALRLLAEWKRMLSDDARFKALEDRIKQLESHDDKAGGTGEESDGSGGEKKPPLEPGPESV